MKNEWYKLGPSDPVGGLTVVRIGVALIILMHPLHGFAHMEDIPRFGEYLSALGYPMGLQLAWMVLLIQTAASLALIIDRWVIPACLGHIVVVCFGLVHVHMQNGWYVVGPGQGGMEWGFILLVCLFGVLWAYWPRSAKAPA
ncbi:DoxX family protein [Candidatus Aalborgicola defluviihabitans]|jgi:putative oxidoreductase|uniref:DoxX family protein n=1 Tax=Candidatus Aalborgicola defluviihabitans TaxID=3386187 RepID=UPI001EC992D1|nr:DoxX family protein [Burkholderiales bacterium]